MAMKLTRHVRLQKHIKREELEAAGIPEEVHNLDPQELDEGDLFGIRAIELGYYGGVAQSRPTSAAGSYSPSASMSDTLMESCISLNLHSTTPTTSVQSLPLVARQPSPLALDSNESHAANAVTSPVDGRPAVNKLIYARCYQPWGVAE